MSCKRIEKETLVAILQGIGLQVILAYSFYQSVVAFFLLFPVTLLWVHQKRKERRRKDSISRSKEFKDMILSLLNGLIAGYSVENAFVQALEDMRMLYSEKSYIYQELKSLCKQLENNKTPESLVKNMAERSGVEDMRDFADVFTTAKRSGGDFVRILKQTIGIICDKLETEEKIQTMLQGKKMEEKVMSAVPMFILCYMSLTAKGFFEVLYHNLAGNILMTICLILYGVGVVLANRICEIEV